MLPLPALKKAQEEMLNYNNSGMSVMEMSHRSKPFEEIIGAAEANLRQLLNIPSNYKVLFLQGGASLQFAMLPMNLAKGKSADYIVNGTWSKTAMGQGKTQTTVRACWDGSADNFIRTPDDSELDLDPNAAFVYHCCNETIQGVQFQTSSSCAGPYPIKIRMKARAQFQTKEEPKNYISAENFSYNSIKDPGATVKNTDGMANYVDVTFTAGSQGFYITNSTHSSSTMNAIVTIESAQALSNGVEVSMPGKVGFYQDTVNGASSAYLMENRTITLKDGNGLPFQISSSYSGPYPITIRMKVEVEFY